MNGLDLAERRLRRGLRPGFVCSVRANFGKRKVCALHFFLYRIQLFICVMFMVTCLMDNCLTKDRLWN